MASGVQQAQVRLGKKIQKIRKMQGITQEAFAEKVHIIDRCIDC